MKEIVKTILANMQDSVDPIKGSVFEKNIETDFASFCVFILSQYENVTMEAARERGVHLHLYYNGPKATDHIATYIPSKKQGCFGGSRVGSKNAWYEPDSPVKNPFNPKGEKYDIAN